MADEAFALSPISARSASPSEADYDAISAAFMETARGRWFLSEYAKRNRNADTAMVLEAVTRLEQSLAASRPEPAATGLPLNEIFTSPALQPGELLASVGVILERTRAAIVAAMAAPDAEQPLSPFRRCARIVQEIAWGLRESGSDGRICAMLDAQVHAMNVACETFGGSEHRDAVLHAFDASLIQIGKLAEPETIPPISEPGIRASEGGAETTGTDLVRDDARTEVGQTEMPPPLHMSAMDDSVIDVAPSAAIETMQKSDAVTVTADELAQKNPVTPSSLGESLLARGIVSPATTAADLLAPIRRMSQAEKIAFFS